MSAKAHEKAWSEEPVLRQQLESLRKDLDAYARALAEIAGVED